MSQRDAKGRFSKEFGIGDRVVGVNCLGDKIDTTIDRSDTSEPRWHTPRGWCYTAKIRLAKPAPQPKAEDGWIDGKDLAARDAEIERLKAEVERLDAERRTAFFGADHYKASCDGLKKDWDDAKRRAEAAEAKLADIKAIIRTFKILNDLPGKPGFTDAVNAVLDGAA